jgi:hypothetical protein
MTLQLDYAVGDASVNLSGLAVRHLAIESGSADVDVRYDDNRANQLEMDTMRINIDMGSLRAHNVHLSRARVIMAEVGFGHMRMNLASCSGYAGTINAHVGAGTMQVTLPAQGQAVKIVIDNSPLCRVALPPGFESVEKNVFVNGAYQSSINLDKALTFNLDVGLGKISFVND